MAPTPKMVRVKAILGNVDGGSGAIATYVGAVASSLTSSELVNFITIMVGVLTAVKLIIEIKRGKVAR